tara:strand:+ start:409 stop:645 length:237 start_codon:yes stop_codon:yes gene_type:complete
MLKIFLVSILMVWSIFFSIYPQTETSPHNVILNYLGINSKPSVVINIILGLILYILAIIVAHLKIENNSISPVLKFNE